MNGDTTPHPVGASARIRDLTDRDLDWVARQERAIFGRSAWSPALIREQFLYGASRWRGIETDTGLAGYAVYGFDGDAFHLMNIAVDGHHRGAGLGRALLADLFAEAARLDVDDVWLEVAVTNDAALGLYREHGFEGVRVRRKYYQPEGVDALVMRKPLR